jgi:hypothetical protein
MGKKYSVNWENNVPVSFEVDGVEYSSLEDIPNPKDQRKLKAMLDTSEFDEAAEKFDAGISSFFNLQKLSKEQSAAGVVVDVVKRREYVNEQDRVYNDYYFPVVQFTAVDGKIRQVQMSEGSSSQEYEQGNQVTVLYNSERPLDARIKSVGSSMLMWILPGITGILGIVFGGAVLVVRKFLFAESESSEN